ncbi:nicotinate-nucleotide adenylyltransferase [Luteimonas sp. SX5]|uniref:Probable nicotinate-nucleotide adenylyltransferase n=1 Tax=Luteimonas galliterrae TaxID=2940486 RepID=A0ABT0ME31_9GAMM|nr:nicotinate-nucleotide adenylyltransferase [Luteimonas galliterrae]MCL1633131.1 nicotinate-nucleotide adenylyltransferase [Luteimonas galliterrae]
MNRQASLRLLYGGTFDPVHNGHLAVARHARDALGAQVHLMPAADPPHKGPTHADAEQRAAMLALAIGDEPGLLVDRRELLRDGPSYTIDTLRALRAELGPQAPIALLVGADSFLGLPTWKSWRELFGYAHFVVAERPGNGIDSALPADLAQRLAGRWAGAAAALSDAPSGKVLRLEQPLRPESASDIRRRIQAGEPWRDQVPFAVAAYIVQNRLYGAGTVTSGPL